MSYRNEDLANNHGWSAADVEPARLCTRTISSGEHSRETPLPGTITFQAAVVLLLWCVVGALTADAWATPLERVEFESASQRLNSIEIIPGDRIQGYLAKPEGAGPFPAVVGLHGCAGMHDMTRQRLAGALAARGYALPLVRTYATLGLDHPFTPHAPANPMRTALAPHPACAPA